MKLFTSTESSTMMAPLYAMKCLKLLMPRRVTSAISSCVRSLHPVIAMWNE